MVLYLIKNRGLDVHPQTRQRFLNQNDHESVRLLDILYKDEITHVAAGIKWFQYSCVKYNYVNNKLDNIYDRIHMFKLLFVLI